MSIQFIIEYCFNDLIEIVCDGKLFYEEVVIKVKDVELLVLFICIVGVKGCIVVVLSGLVVVSGGKLVEYGIVVGLMQQFYGKVCVVFGDINYGYVVELEELEDCLLGVFKDVLKDNEFLLVVCQEVIQLLLEVQECYNVMCVCKYVMKVV